MSAVLFACHGSRSTAGGGGDAGACVPSSGACGFPVVHEAPGLPPGDYVLIAERPGIIKGAVLRTYEQTHLGYPVPGYGFFVETKEGMVLSKNGKLMTGLASAYPAPMSEAAAVEFAWRTFNIAGTPPWVAQPAVYHPPVGQLALVSGLIYPTAKDFQLAWSFDFQGTGIALYPSVVVDAASGKLISRQPGMIE